MKMKLYALILRKSGKFVRGFFVFVLILLVLSSCTSAYNCSNAQDSSCTRVLFIGNSYTFVNDLPNTFAELAKSGKHKVEVGISAQGGWTLADHIKSADTQNLLNSKKWTYVVLQEQSEIPSVQQSRTYTMYPAARTLVKQIRDIGATPLFFLTWAHRDGWSEYGMPTYESMQYEIINGYYGIAREMNVTVVPAGSAWMAAVRAHPELMLWQEDGSHPTEEGTYLAACVFYATIFKESPVGLKYRAGLSKDTATTIQMIASKTVLNTP
jgi:hypothetical protein